MNIFKNSFNYSTYRKMLFSYMIIIVITVCIISSLLYSLFSYTLIKEFSKESQSMLSQTSYTSDMIEEKVYSLWNILSRDAYVMPIMYARSLDPVKEYHAYSRMASICSAYPYIKYAGIYNFSTGKYVTSNGVAISKTQDADIINLISSGNKRGTFKFLPVKSSFKDSINTSNVLTFIFYNNSTLSTPANSAIIINVDESYIQDTIKRMLSNQKDNTFMITSSGTVLSHSNSQYFMKNLSSNSYIQKILGSTAEQGYFTEKIEGQKQLVTFVKSKNSDFYFISLKPYKELLHNIYRLRNVTLLTALFIMLISVFLSLTFVNIIYYPIKKLFEKVQGVSGRSQHNKESNEFDELSDVFTDTVERANSLESSLQSTYPLLKENYIRAILQGNYEELSFLEDVVKSVDNELQGPYFSVFILKIDSVKEYEKNFSPEDQALIRFGICSIARELLEQNLKYKAAVFEEEHIVVLAQLDENTLSSKVFNTLAEIQSLIEKYYKISVSIVIGDIVSDRHSIHMCYDSALEYLHYTLFFESKCVIDYNKIREQIDNTSEYPLAIESKLLKSIEMLNREEISENLKKFIETLAAMNYSNVLIYSCQLVISILKNFSDIPEIKTNSHYKVLNEIQNQESLKEVGCLMEHFCYDICSALDEGKNKDTSKRIASVLEYIEENYHNPALSLDIAADYAALSQGYFGKLFRKATGLSFSDYLNELRLKKAVELMLSTDEPIAAICEKVGIYNNTYFFTLFKKHYKTTPALYRKNTQRTS